VHDAIHLAGWGSFFASFPLGGSIVSVGWKQGFRWVEAVFPLGGSIAGGC